MLQTLLDTDNLSVNGYKICLVQNKRRLQIIQNGNVIFDKTACWATFWEVEQLVGLEIK